MTCQIHCVLLLNYRKKIRKGRFYCGGPASEVAVIGAAATLSVSLFFAQFVSLMVSY